LNSQQAFQNKYFSKNKFQKYQQYSTTVIENVKNKPFEQKLQNSLWNHKRTNAKGFSLPWWRHKNYKRK